MKELKKYLTINSIFSAISGIAMLVFPERLSQLFNISNAYVFPIIGGCLLLFAVCVWFVASRKLANKMLVQIITLLDILWVIGSFLIVLLCLFSISTIGNIIIVVIAIWIAFLAYKQIKYNR